MWTRIWTLACGACLLVAATQPQDGAAQSLWKNLLEAAQPTRPGTARKPVSAFDLTFDGRARMKGKQSNDFNNTRYRFLAPSWVRTSMESGVDRMRGPEGDWLVDEKKKDKIRLVGRDFAEDRRELGDFQNIARNFVNLTDPARLQVQALRVLTASPATLPASLAKRAAELDWIEITSPDFRLTRSQAPDPDAPFKAQIGLDKRDHLPRLAIIWEDDRGQILWESALCVELDQFRRLDDFQVPFTMRTYPPAEGGRFADRWELQIWLIENGASLRPKLTPRDFVP
jgi:hypothetical protein